MVDVSVIIPTYNRAERVTRAIDSVLAQTYDSFEIIVIDDYSSDDTAVVVDKYDDSRIRYVKHNENLGACAARNTGIKRSNGQYLAFLDSDDEWDPTKLAKQVSCMEKSPERVGIVYTGYRVQRSNNIELGRIPTKNGDIHQDQLIKDWVSPTSAVMIDRRCFNSVGMFDTDLNARQDYDMWLRLSRKYEFDYVKEPLVTLHIDGEDRISADVDKGISAHKTLLKRISAESESLPFVYRHRILASQYFIMARHLQRHGYRRDAVMFFIYSLIKNPVSIRTWLAFSLLAAGLSPDDGIGLRMKNSIRKIKLYFYENL